MALRLLFQDTANSGSRWQTPDGVDQNSNPVNNLDGKFFMLVGAQCTVTVVLQLRSLLGNPDGSGEIGGSSENSWLAYSYDNPTPGYRLPSGNSGIALGGRVNSYNTFAGGALAIGQTVSINFVMRATESLWQMDFQPARLVLVCLMAPQAQALRGCNNILYLWRRSR